MGTSGIIITMVRRRLLVMADLWGPLYEWDAAGKLEIAKLDELPISTAVRQQLRDWVEDWKDESGHNYGRLRREAVDRLRRQGKGMTEAIRRELGEEFEVFYAEVPDIGAPAVPDLPEE